MKHYLLLVLFSVFTLLVSAHNETLSGTVKFSNGKPVSDATIAIRSLNKYTLSDENGVFSFSGIKSGKYDIEVISIEVTRKTFNFNFNDKRTVANLVVEPSDQLLNEVTVSANSHKKEIETRGFAVNVIETQKLATQSIQTNELLDRTAGVRVRQDGGLGSQIIYNVNGLSGNAIRIFIDGVPADNYGSSFSLNSIPPALIERIEVYKGVVPGNLSEDALGGAINVILKKNRGKSLMTSYSVGSFNTHQWNATGSNRWENGFTVDGSAFFNYSDNDYKVWGDDIKFEDYKGNVTESNGKKVKRFHDAYKSLGGMLNMGFMNVIWADKFLVGVNYSQDYDEKQHGTTMKVVYGDRHSRRRSMVTTLAYEKKNVFTEGLSFKLDASHSYIRRQAIDSVGIMYDWAGPIRDENGNYMKHNSGAEASNEKTANINRDYAEMVRANITYNFVANNYIHANYLFNNFRRKVADEYKPAALQLLENTRDYQKNVLAFTYENHAFSERLKTNIFYKHYFQEVKSNEPVLKNGEVEKVIRKKNMSHSGYGITLSYALLPNLYLLGSAEKAIRLPSAKEMFGEPSDNLISPKDGLDPEKSTNANLGFNYGFTIDKHSINLNSTVFYRDTKGMIRMDPSGDGRNEYSVYENLDNVLSKGIDAEVNYNYDDKINFRFNVSKFDVLFNTKYDAKGDPYNFYKMQIRNEPSLKFNGNLAYNHKNLFLNGSNVSVYYNINYVKEFSRNWPNVGSKNLDYIPTQYPMDVGFAYTFPQEKMVLSFDAKNIFNKQVYDNFGLQKPGIAFYTKLTYFIL